MCGVRARRVTLRRRTAYAGPLGLARRAGRAPTPPDAPDDQRSVEPGPEPEVELGTASYADTQETKHDKEHEKERDKVIQKRFLGDGESLNDGFVTLDEAAAYCSSNEKCAGYTVERQKHAAIDQMFVTFKDSASVSYSEGWDSYTKDVVKQEL